MQGANSNSTLAKNLLKAMQLQARRALHCIFPWTRFIRLNFISAVFGINIFQESISVSEKTHCANVFSDSLYYVEIKYATKKNTVH